MVKSTKTQRLREKVRVEVKYSKQTTLGNLQETRKIEPSNAAELERKKQIEITEVSTSTREDELALKVGFRLLLISLFNPVIFITRVIKVPFPDGTVPSPKLLHSLIF
jgi:hypothetical protein